MPELHDPTAALLVTDDGHLRLGPDDLERVLADLGLAGAADEALLQQSLRAHGLDGPPFEIRIGPWRVDLPAAIARGVLNGAVLTAVLASQHETSIPVTVLSVVVPLVFDLERIYVSPSDKVVFAHLLRDAPDRRRVDDWYASLPAHLRDEISTLEFRDLLARLEDADLATLDELDVLQVDPPTPRRLVGLRLPPIT
jgi:hypothetical protein